MNMKYLSIVLLLLIYAGTAHAKLKGIARLDSLKAATASLPDDTSKVNVLAAIGFEYAPVDPDSGLVYAKQCLTLATRLTWIPGIGQANSIVSLNYRGLSDYAKALQHQTAALQYLEQTDRKRRIAIANLDMGIIYRLRGEYPTAMDYCLRALKMTEALKDETMQASVLMQLGNLSQLVARNDKAEEYYQAALMIAEKVKNPVLVGKVCSNMGVLMREMGNYDKALEYYFKSLAINEEIEDRVGTAVVTGNIGNVYSSQKNYEMALEYQMKAAKLYEDLGEDHGLARNLGSIGTSYLRLAKEPAGSGGNTVRTGEGVANPYKQSVKIPSSKAALLQLAIAYSERGLKIAREINSPETMQACFANLDEAYRLSGDFRKAMEASDNLHAIQDSLFSKDNEEQIIKMEVKNDYDRQRLTDSLKTAEKQKLAAIQLSKQKTYTYMGIAGILLLAGFSFFIVKERGKSEQERKKSDGLLLNILPEEVAAELKANGTTAARHYDNVTVLFTDFVNFTQASEQMSAQGLIDELHECFTKFDEIAGRYGIEKIKTIGDAYLAVCGLPTPDTDHAVNIVKAAIEINTFMADRLARMGSERTFAIRIGVHSGSVVAGIVGVKKFAYDIWGDTVNTAARMEQNGVAGKINLSEATYHLVKDKVKCTSRGEMEVKGKGVMKMYFVG